MGKRCLWHGVCVGSAEACQPMSSVRMLGTHAHNICVWHSVTVKRAQDEHRCIFPSGKQAARGLHWCRGVGRRWAKDMASHQRMEMLRGSSGSQAPSTGMTRRDCSRLLRRLSWKQLRRRIAVFFGLWLVHCPHLPWVKHFFSDNGRRRRSRSSTLPLFSGQPLCPGPLHGCGRHIPSYEAQTVL